MGLNEPQSHHEPVRPYAYLALVILSLASFLNYADRQIVSILAQSIKADLDLTDAQLGFLLGTAFAIFYAVVGVVMGRFADALDRTRVMALGLTLWSAMTALGGAATGFASLGAARVGVGIGEATANPCSHSLLADFFPPRNRAAAIGTYLAAGFIGSAGAMAMGGLVVQHWSAWCQLVPIGGACGLAGWKAALILMGLPGIPVALLLLSLREPRPRPKLPISLARLILSELGNGIPPFTLFTLYATGGAKAVMRNLALIGALVVAAGILTKATGDGAQWITVALGAYAVVTWGHLLSLKDRPLFELTYGCPTYGLAMASSALMACAGAAVSVWAAPYAMRTLQMPPGQVGLLLGSAYVVGASSGVVLGGFATDIWKRRDVRAPIWVSLAAVLGSFPSLALLLTARDMPTYVTGYFAYSFFTTSYAGAYAGLAQDLVLPRMRATAAASFALMSIVIGSGAGPYWAGKVSTITGSLAAGLVSLQPLALLAALCMILAARRLKGETADGRRERARAAGEPAHDAVVGAIA